MLKVSVIKWSQNCTRTIRNGVVGIPKYLKNACKEVIFLTILAMPKTPFLRVLLQFWDHFMTDTFVTLLLSVIKWSQNCIRTIRNGVVGIPKYLKNACKQVIFDNFGNAKNTTSEGPTSILRPLYDWYFCHITIERWSQIFTMTIRNGFFKNMLFWARFLL